MERASPKPGLTLFMVPEYVRFDSSGLSSAVSAGGVDGGIDTEVEPNR
eukprot:CAMPEP_0119317252 /NCGR_PEP_ID=MMETSP1333-20130426/42518_1 /TAXON_ID=418940 /ORGANISM="Scyphosphaera apsteinii, Strain RCC1455" /LENGTH=47 /DNA_ID= /DNA_START= /DNA_END= /DNA_ORIENTATION=